MPVELSAELRTEFGKEKCKKLREQKILPGNVYGGPLKEPKAIQFNMLETEKLVTANGKHGDYVLLVGGETYPVRIQEVRYEPIYKRFQHLDLVVKDND